MRDYQEENVGSFELSKLCRKYIKILTNNNTTARVKPSSKKQFKRNDKHDFGKDFHKLRDYSGNCCMTVELNYPT
mgnify:CR=1 FL=1